MKQKSFEMKALYYILSEQNDFMMSKKEIEERKISHNLIKLT